MASKTSERFGAGEKLKDINITQDELTKFSKALKDEGFRKLLGEYVDEIRDPENRKRYEEEIALLEQEHGNEITWIHPEPGHVLKLQTSSGGKAFINVCSNQHVGAPSCTRSSGAQQRGLNWSIPYAQSRPREDRDKAGAACTVYDVVFHPDTLYMAGKNPQMRRLVEQTAVDAVDDTFKAGLKRDKIVYPKLQYKGVPQASVIRRRRAGAGDAERDAPPVPAAVVEQLRRQAAGMTLDPAEDAEQTPAAGKEDPAAGAPATAGDSDKPADADADAGFETPKYTVVYRDSLDMQQFAAGCGGPPTRPQALVVRVQLPRLTSAAGLDLDVGTRTLKLRSPAGYRLDAVLPLPVRDAAGSATFDRAARCLVVTLPVEPADTVPDSGIDSDCAKNESDDDAYRTWRRAAGEGEGEGEAGSEEGDSEPAEQAVMDAESESGSDSAEPAATPAADRLYSLPRFTIHRDQTRLYISIQEPNVVSESVRVERGDRCLTMTACSLGAGLTPLHYRLHLALPAAVAEPAVRCGQDSVELETATTEGDWTGCHVGRDATELTEHLISCKSDEPETTSSATEPPREPTSSAAGPPASRHGSGGSSRHSSGGSRARCSASASSLCSVTSCDGLLSLSSQSSVDESLQKKGILKKRHCSESSADELMSPSGSSLVTGSLVTFDEAEEATIKKSVSFSNHVVEKRYRTNSTILHDTARTERQRAKKKRQRAARRHSEGDTSENDEFRSSSIDDADADGEEPALPRQVARRNSSDGDTSENDEFQSSATDGSTGGGPVSQSRKEKKRKNKRKQDRKQKDMLNNELMFDLDM
ncbi:protein kintoun-like [Amphibalanus amphitrite]|uniref:protein kintoun-like n=1 Tax=Amphibalanus amphitrite TaxID=1232801 RepID=UPI001C900BA9|nr:protein kintoun-like [Amphibalanus amphitrite]